MESMLSRLTDEISIIAERNLTDHHAFLRGNH